MILQARRIQDFNGMEVYEINPSSLPLIKTAKIHPAIAFKVKQQGGKT